MAPFIDLSRLSFEICNATRHLLDVRLALFLAPSLTLQAGVILYLQTVSRCQVNSFLSFQFKKIQETAKNSFYLIVFSQM